MSARPAGIGPLVMVAGTFDAPFSEDTRLAADHDLPVVDHLIEKQAARENALLIGGGVNERSKRGPGRAAGLRMQGAVELAVLEVPSADHRQHAAVGITDGDERTLQIFRRARDVVRVGRRAKSCAVAAARFSASANWAEYWAYVWWF